MQYLRRHRCEVCRRYVTLEAALLHCLNGFNDNAAIPDKYESLKSYIDESSK